MKAITSCREERLLGYLEGELNSQDQAKLEVHMAECALCRQRLADLSAVLRCADRASAPRLNPLFSSGLLYRVRQGIGRRQKAAERRRWGLRLAGAAGLVGVLFLFLWPWALEKGSSSVGGVAVYAPAGEGFEELLDTDAWGEISPLQTASTEELLEEVGTVQLEDELLALAEEE